MKEVVFYIEQWRKKDSSPIKSNFAKHQSKLDMLKAIHGDKFWNSITVAYFRIKIKPQGLSADDPCLTCGKEKNENGFCNCKQSWL